MCPALGTPPAQARNTCSHLPGVRAPAAVRVRLPAVLHQFLPGVRDPATIHVQPQR
ncbi:hypothetical protein C2845_PM08G26150 [Panicum miliaceum]|uniref:Uncharacterized protein n=1 Tax=Panicum miliaceum TaxID=4540 RepID=A0A3L6R034_PANMI|nr:hypothetical protein C2845_PM08G26150 [Panicum miliaceum]